MTDTQSTHVPAGAVGEVRPDHATLGEPSDYAVVGRPIRVLRLGPVYDRRTGRPVTGVNDKGEAGPPVNITDTDCAEMVRVFTHRRSRGDGVPIDWNHASRDGGPPEESSTFGEVLSLRHVPGDGLYAELGYSARGERVVRDASPALWTSPDFVLGPVFDKSTGECVGNAELRAVALTPYPRQDRTDSVRLAEHTPADSRNGGDAMPDIGTQNPAAAAGNPPVVQAADPPAPDDMKAMMAALQEENDRLKAELAALMEKLGAYEQAEKPAAALAEVSRRLEAKLSEERKAREGLAAKLAESEKARASEKLAARLDAAERDGWYAPSSERRAFFVSLAERPALLDAELARLAANPEVPLGEVGHGKAAPVEVALSEDQKTHRAVLALCEAQKWDPKRDYQRAYKAVRAARKGA